MMYEDLEMFLSGDPPSTPAKWISEVVENILKQQKKD
jgi:hypothetical protein